NLATSTISIALRNDPPMIKDLDAMISFTEDGKAVAIADTAFITDTESFVYDGGYLQIDNTNGQATDVLSIIPGEHDIFIIGGSVRYLGQEIGTIDINNNGTNGGSLRIDFTTFWATEEAVTAL